MFLKKICFLILLFLCQQTSLLFAQEKDTFLIDSIDFSNTADWNRLFDLNRRILAAQVGVYEPVTAVEAKMDAEYNVWSYAIDFPHANPGSRLLKVSVNGFLLPTPSGKHGKDGWYWEYLGKAKMKKGVNYVAIKPITNFARSDSLLFTTDSDFNPVKDVSTDKDRFQYRRKHLPLEYAKYSDFDNDKPLAYLDKPKKVGIGNALLRIIFTQKKNEKGEVLYARSTEVFKNGKWIKLENYLDERVFLLSADKPNYYENDYFVSWANPVYKTKIVGAPAEFNPKLIMRDPYCAGKADIMYPKSVERVNDLQLILKYSNGAVAKLTLAKDLPLVKFTIGKKVEEDASYSFGMLGFNAKKKDAFTAAFLPSLYQNMRTMVTPKMVSNNFTTQPLAMIEALEGDEKIVSALIADPENLPFGEWSKGYDGNYGLSISSPVGDVQPAIFSPILGGRGSEKIYGEEVKASWYIYTAAANWKDAFETINENIFDASKLREAYDVSFSDAVANIAEYLKNKQASGWSDLYKARTQIEAKNSGTQANPLAEIEIALLTDDEEYYSNISLPTIEYTLSRKFVHFTPDEPNNLFYRTNDYAGDYFAAVFSLLGKKNEFLKSYFLNEDGSTQTYGKYFPQWSKRIIPEWTVAFGIYLATGDAKILEESKKLCDDWLAKISEKKDAGEPVLTEFINFTLYPYWWYLPQMYEATGDKKYLDAAEDGAFYTLSSLWNFPSVPNGNFTIHKNGYTEGVYNYWWRGNERFRLGFDENSKSLLNLLGKDALKAMRHKNLYVLPAKEVEAMKVSRIGLSIEQHSTFLQKESNFLNIDMPSWSAEMLKTYQYTKRDILMKFSRHSIIGRFSNFLGYYVIDYTDVMHDEAYPYKGPDVTTFYYHHAPCHFAQSFDYLMAQFEIASDNKIKFPTVRQQGYVWFTDRIFGIKGSVFGEENCRIILDKSAVRADSSKVSTLCVRGKDSVWVLVLNDSGSAHDVKLKFNPASKAMKGVLGADIALYDASGTVIDSKVPFSGEKVLNLKPLSMVAYKLPALPENRDFENLPALSANAVLHIKDFAPEWGDLHAYRIRGPFGKDSLFAILTGGYGKAGAKVILNLQSLSKDSIVRDVYPYEFSLYPISPSDDISFSITIKQEGKPDITSQIFTIKK